LRDIRATFSPLFFVMSFYYCLRCQAQPCVFFVGQPYPTTNYKLVSPTIPDKTIGAAFERKWSYADGGGTFSCSAKAVNNKLTLDLEEASDNGNPGANDNRNATWQSNGGWVNFYSFPSLLLANDRNVTITVTFNLKSECQATVQAGYPGEFLGGGSARILMLKTNQIIRHDQEGKDISPANPNPKSVFKQTISGMAIAYGEKKLPSNYLPVIRREWGGIVADNGKKYEYYIYIPEFVNSYFRQHPEIQSQPPAETMDWQPTVLGMDSYITPAVHFKTQSTGHIEVSVVPNEADQPAKSSCPIKPLTPITDPVALQFENGKTIDTEHLTPQMKGALALFRERVTQAGGQFHLTSAYRPSEYQHHLREVWTKWQSLKNDNKPECQKIRAEVRAEIFKHRIQNLKTSPASDTGPHTKGLAIDVAIDNMNLPLTRILAIADSCGLYRPLPEKDRVHFIHK